MSGTVLMQGEFFALAAAAAYGLAGVSIVKGRGSSAGDNGVFLSVVATAILSGGLWLVWGNAGADILATRDGMAAVAIFVLAGICSSVFGRITMYRSTERIGAVAASLLRRLTPVFALPMAVVFLAEVPGWVTLLGGGLVLAAVIGHLARGPITMAGTGMWLGVGSAAFYAAAYTLRSLGLDTVPDAAFGTFIGAVAGVVWFLGAALATGDRGNKLRALVADRGRWQITTALALSVGQTLQFFALKSVPVVVVATLGTLEVLFAALCGALLLGQRNAVTGRLVLTLILAAAGTALLVG